MLQGKTEVRKFIIYNLRVVLIDLINNKGGHARVCQDLSLGQNAG